MGNKMLIDAAHPEETRVVVLRGNRIEEFDFEAANKKQLRGNIYLAKVTRVEPSLQAAFIEYGGNRHGFLAFSEIHPDYYQIPVADRQQLLEDEARSAEEDEEEPRQGGSGGGGGNGQGSGNGNGRRSRRHRRGGGAEKRSRSSDDAVVSDEAATVDASAAMSESLTGGEPTLFESSDVGSGENGEAEASTERTGAMEDAQQQPLATETAAPLGEDAQQPREQQDATTSAELTGGSDDSGFVGAEEVTTLEDGQEAMLASDNAEAPASTDAAREEAHDEGDHHDEGEHHDEESVEQLGGDALEEVPHRASRPRRHYKIQEVIKRRQVLLVQVVKEERGNKGAALTTYLSLAGRYSVLMPNTARGGGISRKIVDPEDRKRLKAIAQELEVPEGMGIILRTAGASRGMPEVKRDFEYLMRMWETVRETTLQSTAPTLVYEEGSLIKRSIRDLYSKEIDEVVVAGDEGYREAKDFMRLLMPSQIRNVVSYRDAQPVFAKHGVEAQLDAMFSNQVVLKSGGYLVINQTEALVAIDVNSGRSTREHNIEDTALRTNLEAADEVARQLRLRDLAGLIVVDFIDMEEGRNDRAVERRLKDALKNDRARIQIGRISHFGLLEMSRQRMRTGVLEGSTVMCPHCAGSGMVRSVSSQALHVLRLLEDALIRSATHNLIARTRSEVALYILNQKRANLLDLEGRFGVAITVLADPGMTGMVYHAIERGADATPPSFLPFRPAAPADEAVVDEEDEIEEIGAEEIGDDDLDEASEAAGASETGRSGASSQGRESPNDEGGRRKRRRRRRRGRDNNEHPFRPGESSGDVAAEGVEQGEAGIADEDAGTAELTEVESGFLPEGSEPQAEASAALPSEGGIDSIGTSAEQPELFATPAEPAPTASEPESSPTEAEPSNETVGSPEAVAEPAEAPRRRRSTRRTTARSTEAPTESDVPAAEEAAPAPRRSRRTRSRAAEVSADQTTATAGADADTPPTPAATEPTLDLPVPTQENAVSVDASDTEAPAVAETPEAAAPAAEEPNRPKRSGWWQRARATLTGGES